MWSREGPEGAAQLQSLAGFLERRRPRVAKLLLSLEPPWGQGERSDR